MLEAVNPWLWAFNNKIELASCPFSLDGHQFQIRPMTVQPPIKVIRKATQMAFTESEVLNVLHSMIHGLYPQGVLYLFPSQDEVTDFSASRFGPLIKDNPYAIGAYVRDTNRANLKRIGRGHLYFRSGRLGAKIQGSMKTSSKLKSVPADHAVHDEYDEMTQSIDEFVDGRLAKSKIKSKSYLANPTLPDYGTDKKFQLSDQEYWILKCRACGAYTNLDEEGAFPDCLHELKDGTVIRACKKCGRPLDPRNGEWVPMRPSITDILGFTISHLNAPWIDPASILKKYRDPNTNIGNFTRLVLGKAYVEAQNRLTIEQIVNCCSSYGIASGDPGPCFMGVDQGGIDKDLLHIVIGKKDDSFSGRIVHISIEKGWSELDRLMKSFHVVRCVIDALPETDEARKFAKRFPGKVFLSYYNEHQKGAYKWNEEEYTVTSNRTESLDSSHKELQDGELLLPKNCDIVKEYANHCHNVAKKLEEDEETGSKRYVYVKLGPDHFRHAQNYEAMARQGMPNLLFPEMQ